MYASLLSIKDKYENFSKQLLDPAVFNDIKKYNQINKEQSNLEEIYQNFLKFLSLEKEYIDAKELLNLEKDEELIALAKDDIASCEQKMLVLEEKLKELMLPQDENDKLNVFVEIRGAAGGDEANIFSGDLFKMYQKYCENEGFKLNIVDSTYGTAGGFSQIVFLVKGEKVFSKFKFEQRVPATETQGRVHTSTATVTVIPEIDETINIEIKPEDIEVNVFRSSGAGGQSVNTTDSAVRIIHKKTRIVVTSQDERSQIMNRETAMKMLKSKLYEIEMQKMQEQEESIRKLAGTGDRSEKIRTYNYPQDRITDHRIGMSTSLKIVMDGGLNKIIDALIADEKRQKLEQSGGK